MKKKILIIGPSIQRSKGGMATVIKGIIDDKDINMEFDIDLFESYIDGNVITRMLFSIYALLKLVYIYKDYDLFHIHMASYGSTFRKMIYVNFLKQKNKHVILHIHGAEYKLFYDKLKIRNKERIKNLFRNVDKVIVLSDGWNTYFNNTFKISNLVTLNNCVNSLMFKECFCEDKTNNDMIFLGRIGERKGAYDLLQALEEIKNDGLRAKCYFAGDGEVEKFKKIVKEKGLEEYAEVVGWINGKEKMKLLKNVSISILPSYNEGLPMTILECMACGKALIVSNVGAIPEVVENEKNGIIVNPGNVYEIKKAIEILVKSNSMILDMGKNNVEKIYNFYDSNIIHRKLIDLYKLVLDC